MNRRRKITLFIAMVLSLAVFVQNIQAIRVVRAAEPQQLFDEDGNPIDGLQETPSKKAVVAFNDYDDDDFDGDDDDIDYDDRGDDDGGGNDGGNNDDDDDDDDDDDEAAAREAASREAAEQASREAEEERRQQEEEEKERKRQELLEKAAEENEAAQKKQQEEEDAKYAQELADKKEAEAKKAAEESEEEQETVKYKLVANPGSLNFGEAPVGSDRTVYTVEITNASTGDADFTFYYATKTGAFTCNLSSGQASGNSYHLGKGDTAAFSVSMKSNLEPGKYSDALVFQTVNDDGKAASAKVSLKGSVAGKKNQIKSVTVSPQNYKLTVGDSYQFTATVKDSDGSEKDIDQRVSWEVRGARSASTKISSDGVLKIGKDESSTQLKIYAFSKAEPSVYGTSNVTPQRSGFNVTVAADPWEGGSVTGGGAVAQGGSVTVTAIPDDNYVFVGWVRDGKVVSTATNYTISNVQQSFGIIARFERRYVKVTLERNDSDGGKVSGGGKIRYGESTTITARANDGYVFTGWKEDGDIISKDASMKLKNLKEDRKIKGMFERTSHTITLTARPSEGGTVTGGGTFKINEGTTVKAVPNNGYTFVGWEVNGQIVNRNATVKIDRLEEDYKCTAVFLKTGISTFEISAGVATTGGSVSPSGKSVVAQGQNITYTITPKAGFAILAVAVDGAQVGPVSTYTFSNVQGNHTIAAAFLLTDAGKANAANSGKKTQTQKVQKVERTASNTASAESTVKLEDALSGEGGDDYVEVMNDLDSIPVPSDEELGIDGEEDSESKVAAALGVSQEEAVAMAEAGDKGPVLRAAFYAGALGADAVNQMEPSGMNGVDYTNMTTDELMQVPDDEIYPSYTNLVAVVEDAVSNEDMVSMVKGGSENISVSLTKMGEYDIAPADEKILKSAVGKKPVQYFDLSMMKTVDGNTENIHDLGESMEVVIEIPDEVYKPGKTYSVMRVHKGELRILPDLDDNPKTITFRTDRFSTYAIAQEVASTNQMVLYLTLGALIALLVALSCFLMLVLHQAKIRKARRRLRAERRRREQQF